eukprot:jgi/Ulvmu1/1469/UM011_0199.1
MGTEAVHTGTFLRGPYSIDRLHQRMHQRTSPGLNIDALLSPRDDVRLGHSPNPAAHVSLSGQPDALPPASPPLCRSNSALPMPTTGHPGGPSLLTTSPMCMQSALSDLFNPDSVKRSRLEEVEAFMTGAKRARADDPIDDPPHPAGPSAPADLDRAVPPSDLRRVGRIPQSELNLKLTPDIVPSKRGSIFSGGNLDTFDPSLSSLAGLFPASYKPGTARAGESRRSEIAQHLTAAFDRLTQPEQQRVCGLLNQPSIGGCLDTLLSVVSSASEASDGAAFAAPPQASAMDAPPMFPGTVPLRMESFAAAGPSDTYTNPLHTLGSSRLSPRITIGAGKLTPREVESMPMQIAPGPAPPPQHRGAQHSKEYGSALLDQLQEAQRAASKRRAAVYADDAVGTRIASPRRRKTGPPSSRDKVWELLTPYEKKQILADHMSAAEGTKALLERRAEQLSCEVVDMTDDDDWDIGFRLTECRATSEPLPKPKNCSICLRNGVVLHRHSYYCRRCAQLYRAIHRKKTTLQNDGQGGSQ